MRWTARKARKIERSFEGLLEASPPLPLVEISKRLKAHTSTLLSKFPELCRKAVARYRAHTDERRRAFWEGVWERLEKQLTEKAPLSVAEVAREIGRSRTAVVRQFPALCAKLFEYWVERRNNHWDEIDAFLQNSLESSSPLCLRDIAEQLKLSHTSLYNYFPELCGQIAARYSQHREEMAKAKKEQIRQEIKQIAIDLYEEGIYPTVRNVAQRFSIRRYLRSNKVALVALREVRHKINQKTSLR
jgi:DNA-binding Lrp family transcriptional regulator